MNAADLLYTAIAVALFGLGLGALTLSVRPLKKLLGANVMGLGVFALLIVTAHGPEAQADPVPHALVITGIVVAVSSTGLGLVLIRRAGAAPGE
ncbi:MAG: NADH-quinone oxidoreductase subunit K [Alphaproteobacteria bacterium]